MTKRRKKDSQGMWKWAQRDSNPFVVTNALFILGRKISEYHRMTLQDPERVKRIQELHSGIKSLKPFACLHGTKGEDLVNDVKDAIAMCVENTNIRVLENEKLTGSSGIRWEGDIVVRDDNNVYAIIECKNTHSKRPDTNTQAFDRAFVRLTDLRNYNALRFLVIRKVIRQRYIPLFESIGARIIDWDNDLQWFTDFAMAIDSKIKTAANDKVRRNSVN